MDTTREDAAPGAALVKISEAEARALLETQEVGRLVYTRRALPVVIPVNYAVRDGAVWIWTASTSSMAQAARGAVVAFEVDELDREARAGWSVLVLGVAELVVSETEVRRAREAGPEPWVPARKEHLVRIPIQVVTGRMFEPSNRGGRQGADHKDPPSASAPLADLAR
jgi:nitroimidazol reductase NimA-like FMN-containing flavoprotein (pyridoxamine 5'-phosphate oxidase superfamily)